MSNFELAVLCFLGFQTALTTACLIMVFRLEKSRTLNAIRDMRSRLQAEFATAYRQHEDTRLGDAFLKFAQYPLVAVSQIPVVRRWYFAKLREARALLREAGEK